MPVARTHSIALVGVEGYPVEIESDIENGLPCLFLVGLPDTALREARDRIRAAIINSREQWPQRRITVGLSPASLPKRGSGFDLGIALSILAAAGTIPAAAIDGVAFLGELGLDGRLRPVRGVLPAMAAAAGAGFAKVVVAQANVAEAALVPGLRVAGAANLAALLAWLRGERDAEAGGMACAMEAPEPPPAGPAGTGGEVRVRPSLTPGRRALPRPDLSDVLGQPVARGQDHACGTAPHCHAPAGPRRGARGHLHPFGGRDAAGGEPADDRAAVLCPPSHGDQGGHRRWRQRDPPPGRRLAGPLRLPVPR